jgi:hypothetical protein
MNYITKYKEFQNKFNSDVENLYNQFIKEKGKILDQVYEIINSYSEDIIEYYIRIGNIDITCLECTNGEMCDLTTSIEEKKITLTGENHLYISISAHEKRILYDIDSRLKSEFEVKNLHVWDDDEYVFNSECYINI